MPIHEEVDAQGHYYQWGNHGKKYYFTPHDEYSKMEAYNKAKLQRTAAYSHGWRGHH